MRHAILLISLPLLCSCSNDSDSSQESDASMLDASMLDASPQPDSQPDAMTTIPDGVKCASWNVETIFPIAADVTTRAGDSTSLAFDATGAAHVAFSTNLGLYYGTNTSGSWDFESIPSPRPVSATAIALGSSGRVDIIYYEGENYDVRQVTNATGSWVTTLIADEGIVGEDLTLATDAQGQLRIAYLDGSRSTLVYGARNGSVWTLEDAVSDTPGRPIPSLLVDGTVPLVSFTNYQEGLKFATRAPGATGAWTNEVIDPGFDVGGSSSIAKDSTGALHISYKKFIVDNSQLKYTTNASGTWVNETLDDQDNTGHGTTLRERGGVVHIAYISAASGELRYASRDSIGWTTAAVSVAAGYSKTAMQFDEVGHPAIAFKRGPNALGFATCQP